MGVSKTKMVFYIGMMTTIFTIGVYVLLLVGPSVIKIKEDVKNILDTPHSIYVDPGNRIRRNLAVIPLSDGDTQPVDSKSEVIIKGVEGEEKDA